MFIDRLRESSNLCIHSDKDFDLLPAGEKDMGYRCRICHHSVSITDFLCRVVSPEWSATLAHEFARETGLVDVPCKFHVNQFKDRLVPETVITRLSTVLRGLELLKAIHAPFLADASPVNPKLFKTLMTEYMTLIDRVSSECNQDGTTETVKAILTNMKDAFSNVDMFDQYFNVLVPYVKRAAATTELSKEFRSEHLGAALQGELMLSNAIRNHFSPYCVPFDVIHVMVLCYLCGDHVDLMYNIVLDFASKLCCDYFSFPISQKFRIGIEIQKFLDNCITPTKNYKLYSHLQKYRDPNGLADYFEEKFLIGYGQLESEIRKHVPMADSNDKIDRLIYQQTFPYMLFEKDSDYYSFVMALAHFASKSNLGSSSTIVTGSLSVPKGVERECKRVYRFVKKCMTKVKEFTFSGEVKVCWTKHMFELFVASDPFFAKELIDIISIMIPVAKQ